MASDGPVGIEEICGELRQRRDALATRQGKDALPTEAGTEPGEDALPTEGGVPLDALGEAVWEQWREEFDSAAELAAALMPPDLEWLESWQEFVDELAEAPEEETPEPPAGLGAGIPEVDVEGLQEPPKAPGALLWRGSHHEMLVGYDDMPPKGVTPEVRLHWRRPEPGEEEGFRPSWHQILAGWNLLQFLGEVEVSVGLRS